ncbi:MAG: hydrolase [Gammaproteobacteria bacterium]
MSIHPNILNAEDGLLVIVDLQSKLSAAMSKEEADTVTANSASLIQAAGILNIPVLLTEQYPAGLGPTAPTVAEKLPENSRVFDKTGFSCCDAEGFCDALDETARKQVVLVGLEAHVCVLQTALELLQRGFLVHVAEDAVCSRKPEHKFYALERMKQQGVTVTNYESILFEWLKGSHHPLFKEVIALLN